MRNNLRITAIMAVILFAGTTVIMAQYGRGSRNTGGTPLEYCLDIPGLTDAQKAQITSINEDHRKKMDDFRLKRQTAPTFEEMNEVGAAMLHQQNDHFAKVKAVLNAEQVEYLNSTYTTTRPQGPRQAPAYGRGGGRGYGNVAPGRGAGRGRGYGGRGRFCRW